MKYEDLFDSKSEVIVEGFKQKNMLPLQYVWEVYPKPLKFLSEP